MAELARWPLRSGYEAALPAHPCPLGDRIELRGLRFVGAHGATPAEEVLAQPFEVDLDVFADLSAAGASDDLAESIDYGDLCEAVRGVIEGPHVALLERLADKVAEALARAAGPALKGVEVTVRKLRPPVPFQLSSAAVRVYRAGHQPVRAFLALGSNLGDRWENLRLGVSLVPDVTAVSAVYETEPVGGPAGQGPYLNMVAELSTFCSPEELLAAARAAEAHAGRQRAQRWGPRTLDVDVLLYGDRELSAPELQVPHPRMWERGFVLAPLADLAPELVAEVLRPHLLKGVRIVGTLNSGPLLARVSGAGSAGGQPEP
ncbi:MAG: 2-amino-4-hydroxy-6-hydroxymethyldihydropteridine diphosphokinase [Actinobacteria bacterium]|nr:2-amino-4-hydroxy-6-hydroxymethyldihydropteridine diphosphokinase [Actinomycetota bacterium]